VSSLREKLDRLREQPYQVRRRLVLLFSILTTLVVVGGFWLAQNLVDTARRGPIAVDEEVDVTKPIKRSPLDGLRDSLANVREYVEGVSETIPDLQEFFPEKPATDTNLGNHPGVRSVIEAENEEN